MGMACTPLSATAPAARGVDALRLGMLNEGVDLMRDGMMVSAVHTAGDIDRTESAFRATLRAMKEERLFD